MQKKNKVKNLLLYGGVSKEEFATIRQYVDEDNMNMWKIVSVILAVFSLVLLILTYVCPSYFHLDVSPADYEIKYGISYCLLSIYSILLAFAVNFFGKRHSKVVIPIVAVSNYLVLAFFAATETFLEASNLSVVFFVLMIVASLITVRKPWLNTFLVFGATLTFIVCVLISKFALNRMTDDNFIDEIVYGIVFFGLSVFFGVFFNTIRIKGFVLRHFVEEQRDFDSLTKAKSKIAYDREVGRIMERLYQNSECEPFALAIFDVNGLKITNDTYGHEMGNELLIRAVDLIQEHFRNSIVYRIGGDEFAVIIKNGDYRIRNELVRKFKAKVMSIHEGSSSLINDIPVACGMATYDPENDIDFMSVFSRADTIMYDDKRLIKKRNKYLDVKRDELNMK